MLHRALSVLLLASLCAAISGCGLGYTLYQDRRAEARTQDFRDLRLGMSTSEVLSTVGRPDRWDENHWVFERYFDTGANSREFRTVDLFFKQNQLIVAEGVPGGALARIDRNGAPEPLVLDRVSPEPSGTPVEPASTTAVEAATPSSTDTRDTRSAETAVRDWAAAWSSQDIEAYLAAYVDTYAPRDMTHEAWEQQRRTRVARPASIAVTLEDLAVRENGPGSATVTFQQVYRSDRYSDRTAKALELRKVDGQWKITSERSGRVAFANGRPASTPKPVPPAAASGVVRVEIESQVQSWRAAWVASDVDQYLSHYASDYAPAGQTHSEWVSKRRQRLTRPDKIEIQIDDLTIRTETEDRATVTFRQRYRSDRYQDRVTKTLKFQRINGDWKIVSETSR